MMQNIVDLFYRKFKPLLYVCLSFYLRLAGLV